MQDQKRHVVLPVELTVGSDLAVQYFIKYLWRIGDVINLVHVVKASEGLTEIYHGVPGTSQSVQDPLAEKQEQEAIETARNNIAERFTKQMDEDGILHNLHLYLDTVNAPPSAIAKITDRVCNEVGASMVVMSTSNRVCARSAVRPSERVRI